MRKRLGLALVAILCMALPAAAQGTRSMIFGRVLDSQAKAIVGAAVVVRNLDTNTSLPITTNNTGYFEANLLIHGRYEVTAEAPGFKKSVRSGIDLPIGTNTKVDFQLEVGGVTETISVTAEASAVETNAVTSGRIVDNRTIMQMPFSRNNPLLLVYFTPGLQVRGTYRTVYGRQNTAMPAVAYTPNNVGNHGGQDASNDQIIDGIPNLGSYRRVSFMPHSDSVEEMKIETSSFDASTGHAVGATISLVTKSGTNEFHGAGTWLHMQQRWNALPFFTKQAYYRSIAVAEAAGDTAKADALRAKNPMSSGHTNDYSLSIGGPVILPKLYNGKNKLFFFFSTDGTKDRTAAAGTSYTIPTMANREGDFSQLLQVDASKYQLYDPLSISADPNRPGHYIRTAIPGNILPKSRIMNPGYAAYAKLLPTPNNNPASATQEPLNNYVATRMPNTTDYSAYTNRIDYNHSSSHRFFGKWQWSKQTIDQGDWTYESAKGLSSADQLRRNQGATIDWVYTASARTLLNVAVAANESTGGWQYAVAKQYKPSEFGLPAYMDTKASDQHHIPVMEVAGYPNLGQNYAVLADYRVLSGKADLSHIRGNHTIRAGFDMRHFFQTGGGGGYTSGEFAFNNMFTSHNEDNYTPAGSIGHSWAAFMMGLPYVAVADSKDNYAAYSPSYGWFVQDNWRVTPRLSINLGLRMEYEQGMTERFNRQLGYFDPTLTLPITAAAQAAYANNPVPELAAGQFVVKGGTVYSGVGGADRHAWNSELMWLPRVALAYQLNYKTVLRAGYGIYHDNYNVLDMSPNQYGYTTETVTYPTSDYGMTWRAGNPAAGISPMTDPFPVRTDGSRFDSAIGNKLGSMARAGLGYSFNGYDMKRARQQRWRVGIQRQMDSHTVGEVAYVGAWSDHIGINRNVNPVSAKYFATGMVRNSAMDSNMSVNVKNPFARSNFSDLATTNPLLYTNLGYRGYFTSSTIQKNMLLRPYPHMSGMTDYYSSIGKARSHSLEMNLNRRFSKGFNLNVGFTRLWAETADVMLNQFDELASWRPSNLGVPYRLTVTGVYELPFGKGRPFLQSGIGSRILGGFRVGLSYEYQTGQLLEFPNTFYYGDLKDIRSDSPTLDRWFNTDSFERTSSKAPGAYHVRVFPTRVEDVRNDMMNDWSVNAQREFQLKESLKLEFRVDMLNATNRTIFNAANTTPTSTDFGKITATTSMPNRYMQVQARIKF
ncbi:MAG: carboxypeptidase-like regulatory domain-containing protein [Bryobacteraceae bacterium]